MNTRRISGPSISRRRFLTGTAVAGLASLAACLEQRAGLTAAIDQIAA